MQQASDFVKEDHHVVTNTQGRGTYNILDDPQGYDDDERVEKVCGQRQEMNLQANSTQDARRLRLRSYGRLFLQI